MQANSIRTGNNCTRDDVVTVEERSGNRFANTIDINGRSGNKGNDEADCCGEERWNHDDPKVPDVQSVIG